LVTLVLLLTVQCSRKQQATPDTLYRSIEQRFVAGELAQAAAEAARAAPVGAASGPLWAAKFRLQQAKIWVYQGHHQDALGLLKQPLPDRLPDATLGITRNTLLSISLRRTGDKASATQALADAEKLCPNEVACADVRLAQGIVGVENDRLADANHAFELCVNSARTRGDGFLQMQALLNLGVVALRQERYDAALDRFAESSVLANRIGARLALQKATGNVGWALYKLGDYRRALANSQLAGEQAAALGVPHDQVRWLNDAGLSQTRLGDLNAARTSFEQSLQLARSIRNSEEISDALVALASLSLQMGDLDGALNRSREAQQIAQQRGNNSDTLRPALIEALVTEKQGKTAIARGQLVGLQQRTSERLSVRWEVENALAQLSADAGEKAAADAWFRRAIATFHSQRSSVTNINSRLPFVENGTGLYLSYMEYLIRQGKLDDALRVLDQGRAETLSEGLVPAAKADASVMQPSALAKRLDATILVYCLRPGTSYLWAVSPKRVQFFRLPGREVILPLVEGFSRAIVYAKDVLVQADKPGIALYRDLVEPAGSLIPAGGKVFVIADEGLNGLNFETLIPPGGQPHFWIDDVNIVNARSLSLLARSPAGAQKSAGAKRLLLIGDPVYNRPGYVKLPHAREEVASVADHFAADKRVVLTGGEATPAAYQQSQPTGFAYIHFVAHGVANNISPLESAVVLSSPGGSGDGYKLYAREILDQRLNADLVTISSCYGSGVEAYSGEGLVGLSWAFLRAGSHNVVGALWEVSDTSTPQLMNDLYDGLASGSSPSVALRAAKLAMMRRGGVFRKPFYWASFQLYAGA
jgi:CHAT domain-containing protein/tetratricopeptide (TPR) repeat protein